MPMLNGRYFEAKLWRRLENSGQYETTPIVFRAKILTDAQVSKNQMTMGMLNTAVSLVIETIDLEEVGIYDRVELLDEKFQVERVTVRKQNSPYTLGANKFTTKHIKGKLPKVIYLV
jgi:hypothetical protein